MNINSTLIHDLYYIYIYIYIWWRGETKCDWNLVQVLSLNGVFDKIINGEKVCF